MMLQGMTVDMLINRVRPLQKDETILVHAAAGGVGLILCQWASAIGATVIGTVSTEEKAELARANGCDHPILYKSQDFAEQVRELTGGRGVPVVYDSVGKDTFLRSLDCLAPRGMMVSFGQSSGAIEPFSPGVLAQKGSLFLTRPTLFTYIADRRELEQSASALFDMVRGGKVRIDIGQRFPLSEAAEAHRALEARQTTGSTVLTIG
jgi:NADPH2:quinone reductase